MPKLAPSLFGRGIAHARKGQTALANADFAAARAANPGIDAQFKDFGLTP